MQIGAGTVLRNLSAPPSMLPVPAPSSFSAGNAQKLRPAVSNAGIQT
jgi:hypothetical protein